MFWTGASVGAVVTAVVFAVLFLWALRAMGQKF